MSRTASIPRPLSTGVLSEARVTSATYDPAGPSRQVLWDSKVAGLGIRLTPAARTSGLKGKQAVLSYRHAGKKRLVSLGSLSPDWLNRSTARLDLESLRRKAQQLRIDHAQAGTDPAQAKRTERRAKGLEGAPIAKLWAEYVAETIRLRAQRSSRQIARARENLRVRGKPVLAEFGALTAAQVNRQMIRIWFVGLTKGGHPYAANRSLQALKAFYNWLLSEQLVPESVGNPARLIKLNPERARQRYVRDEEMPALLAAIDARHDPVARIYFRLILETGARKSELIAARWNDYDADNKTLTLRNTKAGHDITLAMSESACALVAELPRVDGSPWIFPSDSPDEPRFNFAREWKEIRDASGLQDLRLHDLRRTHGAILVRAGVSLPLVAARLGHKDITTTQQHYAPLETEAQRALAERVSAALSRGLPPVAK